MSDTPETDAMALSDSRTDHNWRQLCRKLERERDEAQEQNSKLLREFAKHSIMSALFGDSKEIKEGAK
jgi:hypothetical protein